MQVNRNTSLSESDVRCRIGGAKSKETRYSTITVGFDRILQPTIIYGCLVVLKVPIKPHSQHVPCFLAPHPTDHFLNTEVFFIYLFP